MPPEFIKDRHISEKYDVYSLGVIIMQIIAGPLGRNIFSEMSPPNFVERVGQSILYTFLLYQFSIAH